MTTQRIKFGSWQPDSADFTGGNTDYLHQAYNVYSSAVGYAPFPTPIKVSLEAPEDINSVFVGKYGADIEIFAGAENAIYSVTGIARSAVTDISNPSGYQSLAPWDFAQFGAVVLACNGQKLQQRQIGIGGTFEDVPDAPNASCIAIVRDFVFANDVDNTNLIKWSDANKHDSWIPSETSLADSQYLADGGAIVNITGGEHAIILQEKALTRASFIGSPFVFQFDLVARIGCFERNSVVQNSGVTYFLSEAGFQQTDGSQVVPIGAGQVDKFFWNDVSLNQIDTMSTAINPLLNLVVWNYTNTNGKRAIMMYNYVTKQWTYGETTANVVGNLMNQGTTLDELDATYPVLDEMGVSLDSRIFIGGKSLFAGAEGKYIVSFEGQQDNSYLTTQDLEFGYNSTVLLARGIIDNGISNEYQVASRMKLGDNILYSAKSTESDEGRADLRSGGRFHRLRCFPKGSWSHAVGVDLEYATNGNR